ncbi:zinc finger protein 236-like [Mizuhopecten yessoensis]|uniref:Zinc finger protein 236 n=1 Tax=Mizuhopecten yessoensis TaxID=6573 RepID=A0A210Q6U8_MIZYE|nr:zinc finger protein 236-like [Mizuhopecten yessoensis]XP_021365633.1 zinc finger protein 236-like [Mizuhopecten yessoensis]OWF44460.1 Zinc finger protein 236 [Mizuhopecten yessoensis]
MVAWNSTEAEFDEERGEIVLISRHRLQDDALKLSAGAKLAKCVGAVSILFVKSDFNSDATKTGEKSNDHEKVTVSLPASLSVVPVPCPSFITPPELCERTLGFPVAPSKPVKVVPRKPSFQPSLNQNTGAGWVQQEGEDDLEEDAEIEELWTSEDVSPTPTIPGRNDSSQKKPSQVHQPKKAQKKPSSFPPVEMPGLASGLIQKLDSINLPQPNVGTDKGIEVRGTFKGKNTLLNKKSTGPNKCKYCRKVINSWESIVEHALEDHGMISEDSDEVACPICKGLFSKRDMSAFIQHVQLHDKNWQNMCKDNPAMFLENSDELSFTPDQDSDLEDNDEEMYLDDFDDSQSDPDQQGSIKRKKGGNRSFPRLNARLTSEVLKCTECGDQVSSYSDILHHCKLHEMFKQCPVCSKQFTLRGGLLRHFITHVDNRVFTCPSCDAYFTRKDNLKRHIEKKCSGIPGSGLLASIGVMERPPQQSPSTSQGKRFKPNPKEKLVLKFGKNWAHKQMDAIGQEMYESPSDFGTPDSSNDNMSEQDFRDIDTEIKTEPQTDNDKNQQEYSGGREENTGHEQSDTDQNPGHFPPAPGPSDESNPRPALSYKCATCDVQFNSIQELKRHVVVEHSEEMPSTSNTQTHQHYEETEEQDIKPILTFPDSNHYTSDLNYTFLQGRQAHSSVTHKSIQEELQAMDVIDIESLGKFTDMDEDSSQSQNQRGQNLTGFPNNLMGDDSGQPSGSSEGFGGEGGLEDLGENSSDSNILGVDSPDQSTSMDSYSERTPDFLRSMGVPKGRKGAVNKTAPICHFCGLVFERPVDILHHGEVHELELPNQCTCTVCLKELSGKDSLLRHANSHIGRWYPCDVCSASFSRKDNLKRHRRKHDEPGGMEMLMNLMPSGLELVSEQDNIPL